MAGLFNLELSFINKQTKNEIVRLLTYHPEWNSNDVLRQCANTLHTLPFTVYVHLAVFQKESVS